MARATYVGDSSFSHGVKNIRGGTSSSPGYWPTPLATNAKGNGPSNQHRSTLPLQTVARMYPTPTATEYGHNQGGANPDGPVRMSLGTMARRGMWPTPSASVGGGESPAWALEKQRRHQSGLGPKQQMQLSVAVKMWPTPLARDSGASRGGGKVKCGGTRRPSLPQMAREGMWQTPVASEADKCSRKHGNGSPTLTGETAGALAPEFAEWLQGFPTGFTDFAPLETPSSRPAPPTPSPPSRPRRPAKAHPMRKLAPLMTSNSGDWRTPRELFAALHAQHDFTLDAAASAQNAQLPTFFSAEDNALAQPWAPHRVWLNPPYGRTVPLWLAKAVRERTLVVVLVPARTDTVWWHQYVMRKATQVAYVRGRLTFEGAKSSAPFPSAIVTYQPGARRRAPIAIDRCGRKV